MQISNTFTTFNDFNIDAREDVGQIGHVFVSQANYIFFLWFGTLVFQHETSIEKQGIHAKRDTIKKQQKQKVTESKTKANCPIRVPPALSHYPTKVRKKKKKRKEK